MVAGGCLSLGFHPCHCPFHLVPANIKIILWRVFFSKYYKHKKTPKTEESICTYKNTNLQKWLVKKCNYFNKGLSKPTIAQTLEAECGKTIFHQPEKLFFCIIFCRWWYIKSNDENWPRATCWKAEFSHFLCLFSEKWGWVGLGHAWTLQEESGKTTTGHLAWCWYFFPFNVTNYLFRAENGSKM